jgi:hypothetical protein
MHALVIVCLALVLMLAAFPAAAQDASALRRELEEMRKGFEAMKQSYERSIEALGERLKRLESATAAPAPPAAPVPSLAQAPPPSTPSGLDLLRRREPFGLSGQRGSGQLLFDMGIAGDFVASITQHNVDKADAGTFSGRENRFFPREVELNLFGQIDPYARAEVTIETGEEGPGEELAVNLAEAHLTLLTLPYGFQAKLGQMRNRYGWSNQLHEHDLPWIDRPAISRYFFGDEGLTEKGVEVTWVPPLPFYLEALAGVFNGDNAAAFGRGRLNEPLLTGRLRTFFELGDEHAIQLGASVAAGRTSQHQRSVLPGMDVRYKYRPLGWLHPLVTIGGEAISSIRQTTIASDGDGIPDLTTSETQLEDRTRSRFGWYLYAELQPWRRWAFGARYDDTEFAENPGREWAIEPYVTFSPSEFLRFRLAYKHTDRSSRIGFSANDASGRIADELLFQATFILGAHLAHPF